MKHIKTKNMNKHIKLFEEFLNEATAASAGAKKLYKTYQKISDRMLIIATGNEAEALVLWGKALDHQAKEEGKPDRNVEGSNREDLKRSSEKAKKAQAELAGLEKQAEDIEKECEPGELQALNKWWSAEKKKREHAMSADWRISSTAMKAYKILGDTGALKEFSSAAQEHEKKSKELTSAEMEARRELYNTYKI
jgi:hypothetical protein